MQHDGNLDTNTDNFILKNICKVFGQFLRIDDFHITMSRLGNFSNDLHFASFTLDGHDVDWKIAGFGDLGKFFINFLIFLIEILQRTETNIGQAIRAKVNRRPRGSLGCNLNSSN